MIRLINGSGGLLKKLNLSENTEVIILIYEYYIFFLWTYTYYMEQSVELEKYYSLTGLKVYKGCAMAKFNLTYIIENLNAQSVIFAKVIY